MLPTPTSESAWSSIYIAGSCAFIQAVQFSIFFASMWPYILTLHPNVTQTNFGIVVALYSFSQCIASPVFGFWSNRIGQIRVPLIAGFVIMAMGNLSYLSLQFLPMGHLYVMMAARFIAGGGTGSMSLLRSYASSASTSQDRSRAIACFSGGLACGSMLGPGIQILFSPLGADGVTIFGLILSIYTAPALLCLFLNISGVLVVYFCFDEKYIEKSGSHNEVEHSEKSENPDLVALLIIILTRFSQVLMVTTIESIGSQYSMMMFGFEKEESVTINAVSDTICGAISAILYLAFIFLDPRKLLKVRTYTIITLSLSVFWFLTTYPYPFLPNRVPFSVNGSDAGCPISKFDWCYHLPEVSVWTFYIGRVITFSIVYTLMNITIATLFSKVIGSRPQGTYQGFFQMAGSLARMIAPLVMSTTYSMYGPATPWQIVILEITVVIILWIVFRDRLVPYEKRFGAKNLEHNI